MSDDKEKYAKHIDELVNAIGDKASRDEIEEEFEKYVVEFKISVQDTKRSIANKYDVSLGGGYEDVDKTLEELGPNEMSVNILARVVFVAEREINAKGEQKTILSGILGDNTGTCPFTVWEKGELTLEKGDVIRIESAYTTEWNNEPQVNVGNRGVIKKESKDALPPGGGGGGQPKETKDVKIAEIKELGDYDMNLLVRVVFIAEKEITAQGEQKTILSGILGDETGTCPFTIWNKGDLSLEKGDVIRIGSAYRTEWNNEPQINVGNRGTVTMEDKDALPPVAGGPAGPGQDVKIGDIKEGGRNLNVVARIISREERQVTVKDEEKTLLSGILADDSGKISYTCWGKAKFKIGDVVQVTNGYIRSWRGMPQFNFDMGNIEKSKEKLPNAEELSRPVVMNIQSLVNSGGMLDASIDGIVLDVRDGSGLIFRCPECNRAVKKNVCKIHETVEGIPDLRVKAVVDDGTGAMTAVIGKDLSEKLIGKSLDECLAEAKDAMDFSIIQDQFSELLVAKPVRAIGSVSFDDFGLIMIVNDIESLKADVEKEARALLEAI
ncbi:MAG: hypothetical protein KAS67_05190 [Thermoplasmata archaeon]|nr:hypothetical protein [Thermoplasmata archaeon]